MIPRPYQNGADLDIFGSYESDDNRVGSYGTKWTDLFLREKVTLYSNGFFYDPKFLIYHFSLAGALKQEDYETTAFQPVGWVHETGVEYNLRALLLPEHPYSLEVFALRYEPLYKEHSAIQHNTIETSQGFMFHYRKKPYFFHTDYFNDSIDTSFYTTNVKTLGIGGEYFKQYTDDRKMSITADFRPSWFSSSSNTDGKTLDLNVGNSLDLGDANIHSSVSYGNFDQNSPTLSFRSDNFNWFEQFRILLPANFRSMASYRYQNGTNSSADGLRELSSLHKDFTWELEQRLYRSLVNTYQFHYSSNGSTGGDSHSTANSLVTNYTKFIPGGTLLAGFNIGRAVTNSLGQASVLNDPYSGVSVPGSFVLRQQNVDPQTIQVYLKNPLPPNDVIQLQENVHYTVLPADGTYEINVFTLPAAYPVPGTFDFLVSYSLTSGDFKLATNVIGFRLSFNLLHDTLYPYASYSVVSSDVLSGVFLGEPVDSKTTIAGLTYHRKSLRLLGEFQNIDWNVSPRDVWRAEIDYVGSFSPTFTYRATLDYQHRHFSQGTIDITSPYTEQVTSGSGSLSKELFARTLLFSIGGNYTRTVGLTDGNAYSVNSSLSWKIGKLDFSLGATAYHSEVEASFTVPTRRTHQYYYLNLKRKLF